MAQKIIQTKKTTLAYGINDSATTLRLTNLLKLDGTAMSASDIGDILYGTFDPGTSREEIFSIASANVTVNSDGTVDITSVVRGLQEVSPYSTGGFATDHPAGAVVVFGNNPQLYNTLAFLNNAQTFSLLQTFTILPRSNGGNATSDTELVTYAQALAMATGTTSINRIVVAGNGGEVLVAGNLVYLDVADGEWKKCDADTAGLVDNIILGIAQGAGTDGGAITNGVLLFGLDSNQTGLTNNTAYYASNTAGGISSTPGTTEVSVGISRSTTSLLFYPRYNQQLTENQQDALVGNNTDIAVGSGNLFVTQTGLQKGAEKYGASGAGTDTYAVTLSPAPTTYDNGRHYFFKADVANTGPATLNINGLGAINLVTALSTALVTGDIVANQIVEVIYNSTGPVFQVVNPASMVVTTPVYPVSEQDIAFVVSSTVEYANTNVTQSSTTGDVLFKVSVVSNVAYLFRLVRDTITNQYVITHTTSLTPGTGVDNPALAVTTAYVYLCYSDAGTKKIQRYAIADLSGVTAMTISGTNWTAGGSAFSDGTNIYVHTATNEYRKYTISGTTATYDSLISYTGAGDLSTTGGVACDGTSVYTTDDDNGSVVINEYALAGGATTGSVTRLIYTDTYPNQSKISLFIPKTGAVGIAFGHTIESNSAVVGSAIKLLAIAQP